MYTVWIESSANAWRPSPDLSAFDEINDYIEANVFSGCPYRVTSEVPISTTRPAVSIAVRTTGLYRRY